jgi:hypothetical protein
MHSVATKEKEHKRTQRQQRKTVDAIAKMVETCGVRFFDRTQYFLMGRRETNNNKTTKKQKKKIKNNFP